MIGLNIKRYAEKKGFSIYKVAKESGLSQSSLSEIVNGRTKNPTIDTLDKIASVLGVTVDQLTKKEECGDSLDSVGGPLGGGKLNNIKKIRLRKEITIKELSETSGVATGYLSDLENGNKQNPSLDTLDKIASALGVAVDQLTKKEDEGGSLELAAGEGNVDKKVQDILMEQLELLAELSKDQMVEPEQIANISLAMVEIVKLFKY